MPPPNPKPPPSPTERTDALRGELAEQQSLAGALASPDYTNALRSVQQLRAENERLLAVEQQRWRLNDRTRAIGSGAFLRDLREEVRLKERIARIAAQERTLAAGVRQERTLGGGFAAVARAEAMAKLAEERAAKIEGRIRTRAELEARHGAVGGRIVGAAESKFARVAGNAALGLAGTGMALGMRGLQGSTAMRKFENELEAVSRELGAALLPVLKLSTRALAELRKTLEGLGPTGQNVLAAGILGTVGVGAAGAFSRNVFGMGLAQAGVSAFGALSGKAVAGAAVQGGVSGLAQAAVGGGGAAAAGGAGYAGRGLISRAGGSLGKVGLKGASVVGLGTLAIEALGGLAPSRELGFGERFPQLRHKSPEELERMAARAKRDEERVLKDDWTRAAQDDFVAPLRNSVFDLSGYALKQVGIDIGTRSSMRSDSRQLKDQAAALEAENRRTLTHGQPGFTAVGEGYYQLSNAYNAIDTGEEATTGAKKVGRTGAVRLGKGGSDGGLADAIYALIAFLTVSDKTGGSAQLENYPGPQQG